MHEITVIDPKSRQIPTFGMAGLDLKLPLPRLCLTPFVPFV